MTIFWPETFALSNHRCKPLRSSSGFIRIENIRTILGTNVRPLSVEFRRIVHYGKIDSQNLTVAHFFGIEANLNGFRMAGRAGG